MEFSVCPDCEGRGGHDNIGPFTSTDMDEWYGDDSYERDQFVRDYKAGYYNRNCETCKGQRVVRTADLEEIEESLAYDREWAYEQRMESMMLGEW